MVHICQMCNMRVVIIQLSMPGVVLTSSSQRVCFRGPDIPPPGITQGMSFPGDAHCLLWRYSWRFFGSVQSVVSSVTATFEGCIFIPCTTRCYLLGNRNFICWEPAINGTVLPLFEWYLTNPECQTCIVTADFLALSSTCMTDHVPGVTGTLSA